MKMTGKHDGMALAQRIRNALRGKRRISEKRMMGGVCFLLREHMLAGTAKPGFLFRVGAAQQARALTRRGATAMRFANRTSKGFVWVDPDQCDARTLRSWIALAERYVSSLPPKKG
jgi:TfoX/Sxy family transcriptional regulator of competence genes